MARKLTKTAGEVTTADDALTTALGAHMQTLVDADGYPVRMLRVAMVASINSATGESVIAVRGVGGYALAGAERENLAAKINKAHQILPIGL